MNQSRYTVRGMTCGHCADSVTRELTSIAGVRQVEVDVASGRVGVTSDGPLPVEDVRAAVTEAGFELVA
ncbi:heavy-metal-associated domain-containing protein [Actinokineospora sp. NPDC004072]